jgi:hypothetical protein
LKGGRSTKVSKGGKGKKRRIRKKRCKRMYRKEGGKEGGKEEGKKDGATSPCLSTKSMACTRRSVSSTSRPMGRSLMVI